MKLLLQGEAVYPHAKSIAGNISCSGIAGTLLVLCWRSPSSFRYNLELPPQWRLCGPPGSFWVVGRPFLGRCLWPLASPPISVISSFLGPEWRKPTHGRAEDHQEGFLVTTRPIPQKQGCLLHSGRQASSAQRLPTGDQRRPSPGVSAGK